MAVARRDSLLGYSGPHTKRGGCERTTLTQRACHAAPLFHTRAGAQRANLCQNASAFKASDSHPIHEE
jgi:hypothetical protein